MLALDRLAALMLVLNAVLGLGVLLYAIGGWDQRGKHFHPLFQFELMGINGAFLTGDFFNLFVFFEILLIASYGLMVHGGGGLRVKAGVQYVVTNLVGSSVFLIAVGMIYNVTGTLNMADLARIVPQVPAADQALLQTGAVLLLLVFAVKAALVPLHFWLPGTYANAPGPVAALFAIMTKVGAYSILRLYVLAFGADAGAAAWLAAPWLLPAGLLTLVLGMTGVLAARSLGQMASYAVIGSMACCWPPSRCSPRRPPVPRCTTSSTPRSPPARSFSSPTSSPSAAARSATASPQRRASPRAGWSAACSSSPPSP